MDELKDLERLRAILHARLSMGFFLDGDEPFANLMIRSVPDRKSHMRSVQQKLQAAISNYSKDTAEIKLEALLDAIAPFWNDSFPMSLDIELDNDYTPEEREFIVFYFEETKRLLAIVYLQYLSISKDNLANIYETCNGLEPSHIRQALTEMSMCTPKRLKLLEAGKTESSTGKPVTDQKPLTPQQKAQQTMREDLEYGISDLIDPVCERLAKEQMVVKSNDKLTWIFRGTEEQYAYMGLLFQKAAMLTKAPWQILADNIAPKGEISTIKRYASEMRQKKRELPEGRVKISSSFEAVRKMDYSIK